MKKKSLKNHFLAKISSFCAKNAKIFKNKKLIKKWEIHVFRWLWQFLVIFCPQTIKNNNFSPFFLSIKSASYQMCKYLGTPSNPNRKIIPKHCSGDCAITLASLYSYTYEKVCQVNDRGVQRLTLAQHRGLKFNPWAMQACCVHNFSIHL